MLGNRSRASFASGLAARSPSDFGRSRNTGLALNSAPLHCPDPGRLAQLGERLLNKQEVAQVLVMEGTGRGAADAADPQDRRSEQEQDAPDGGALAPCIVLRPVDGPPRRS